MPPGEKTVLVAEDSTLIRGLVCHVIQGCGYTVLQADDGLKALDVCRDHPGPIRLLVVCHDGIDG